MPLTASLRVQLQKVLVMSWAMLLVPPVQLDTVHSRWSVERERSCTAPFPASPQPAEPAVPVRSRWYLQVVVAPRLASGPVALAGLGHDGYLTRLERIAAMRASGLLSAERETAMKEAAEREFFGSS